MTYGRHLTLSLSSAVCISLNHRGVILLWRKSESISKRGTVKHMCWQLSRARAAQQPLAAAKGKRRRRRRKWWREEKEGGRTGEEGWGVNRCLFIL